MRLLSKWSPTIRQLAHLFVLYQFTQILFTRQLYQEPFRRDHEATPKESGTHFQVIRNDSWGNWETFPSDFETTPRDSEPVQMDIVNLTALNIDEWTGSMRNMYKLCECVNNSFRMPNIWHQEIVNYKNLIFFNGHTRALNISPWVYIRVLYVSIITLYLRGLGQFQHAPRYYTLILGIYLTENYVFFHDFHIICYFIL